MILKEIEYKDSNTAFDWEEVPQEDLWEDGEITERECQIKIINQVLMIGDWKLIRRINEPQKI